MVEPAEMGHIHSEKGSVEASKMEGAASNLAAVVHLMSCFIYFWGGVELLSMPYREARLGLGQLILMSIPVTLQHPTSGCTL